MQVHGDDVGNGADEILLHAVKHKYSEIGTQTQNYLQKQEAGQRNLTKNRKEHGYFSTKSNVFESIKQLKECGGSWNLIKPV